MLPQARVTCIPTSDDAQRNSTAACFIPAATTARLWGQAFLGWSPPRAAAGGELKARTGCAEPHDLLH